MKEKVERGIGEKEKNGKDKVEKDKVEKDRGTGGESGQCAQSGGARRKERCVSGADAASGEAVAGAEDECMWRCMAREKFDTLRRHLGDGRGECVIIVLLLVFCCCVGVNHCRLCKGWCCQLVNDVVNLLVEYGEIDPNAEVNI